MIVTDKKFFMERLLVEKLDLMVKRMAGSDDNVVLIDGDEGQGKTNLAAGICYYIAHETGRKYTAKDNVFFDLDELLNYAANNDRKIIHWDEGALGGMSVHWWKKNQQQFLQLLMTSRIKRHFIIICIPRFYKLNEYITVDRSIALLHVYSRNNIQKGRFVYYTKRNKEKLCDDWNRKHIKNYRKHKSFWGSFGLYMDKYVFPIGSDEEKEYTRKKLKAISNIVKDTTIKESKEKKDLTKLRSNLQFITYPIESRTDLAEKLEISRKTLYSWGQKAPLVDTSSEARVVRTKNNTMGVSKSKINVEKEDDLD